MPRHLSGAILYLPKRPDDQVTKIKLNSAMIETLKLLIQHGPMSPSQIRARLNDGQPEEDQITAASNSMTLRKLRQYRPALVTVRQGNRDVPPVEVEHVIASRKNDVNYMAVVDLDELQSLALSEMFGSAPPTKSADPDFDNKWKIGSTKANELCDQPIFGPASAGVTINRIFQPALGFYRVPIKDKNSKSPTEKKHRRRVVDLLCHIRAWWTNRDSKPLLFVMGEAGAGKSTLGKKLVSDLTAQGEYAVFVPASRLVLDDSTTAEQAIHNYLHELGYPDNLLAAKTGPSRLLVVIDALDELTMTGKEGRRLGDLFIEKVVSEQGPWNKAARQVFIVFSSRFSAVGDDKLQSLPVENVVEVLPLNFETYETDEIDKPIRSFVDRRKSLIEAYYECVSDRCGTTVDQAKSALLVDQLNEFNSRPLLLALLLVAFLRRNDPQLPKSDDRPGDPFANGRLTEDVSQLFRWLLWFSLYRPQEQGNANPKTAGLSFDDYLKLLTTLGLAVWQRGGKDAAIDDAIEIAQLFGTLPLLERYLDQSKNAGHVPTDLLVVCYTRHVRSLDGRETRYEFTVKAFAEYFAACGLLDLMALFADRIDTPKGDLKTRSVHTEDDMLELWATYAGHVDINHDFYALLMSEVKRRQTHDRMGDVSARLFRHGLVHGYPVHRITDGRCFAELRRQSNRAEHALHLMAGATRPFLEKPLNIEDGAHERASQHQKNQIYSLFQGDLAGFAEFVKRVRKHESKYWDRDQPLIFQGLILQGQVANALELIRADLSSADLSTADLSSADLSSADLSSADLRSADLSLANLSLADLSSADLRSAELRTAILRSANMCWANLSSADLSSANLCWANLSSADLSSADLSSADLISADLRSADLSSADLRSAKLEGAQLLGARLAGATLENATYGDVKLDTPSGKALLSKLGVIWD